MMKLKCRNILLTIVDFIPLTIIIGSLFSIAVTLYQWKNDYNTIEWVKITQLTQALDQAKHNYHKEKASEL